jgi:hypothetical protein
MDDKALEKIDQLLAQIQQSLQEIRKALPVIAAVPPEARPALTMTLRRQARATAEQFMSGRWRRRDGDVYGVVGQNDKQIEHADSTPRDIRPTDERGA